MSRKVLLNNPKNEKKNEDMNQVHELKISSEYIERIKEGVKTFEIRKNDRNYQVGDFLLLKEFTGEQFTGREILQQVTYMTDYEQKKGYVVMSIQSVQINFGLFLNMSKKEKMIFKNSTKNYLWFL